MYVPVKELAVLIVLIMGTQYLCQGYQEVVEMRREQAESLLRAEAGKQYEEKHGDPYAYYRNLHSSNLANATGVGASQLSVAEVRR